MLLRYGALLCIFFFSVAAAAQTVPRTSIQPQIEGQVRYADGGRPAEFVLVRLEGFGAGVVNEVTTDRNGKFRFAGLAGELYNVSVRVPGYREAKQQVDLRTQLTDFVQLQLVPEANGSSSSTSKATGVIDVNVPKKALAEFEKGKASLLKDHNRAVGIAHLEKAVAIYPKYSEALLLLGAAYMDDRRWNEAETTLRRVLAIQPQAAAAHLALGELYLDQKKYSESQTELMTVVSLDPKSARGHLTLGRLYYELGNIAKAGPEVGRALQIDPNFAKAHLLAGDILLRARQFDNALIEFEEYLRLEPNSEFSEQTRQTAQKIRQMLAAKKKEP